MLSSIHYVLNAEPDFILRLKQKCSRIDSRKDDEKENYRQNIVQNIIKASIFKARKKNF